MKKPRRRRRSNSRFGIALKKRCMKNEDVDVDVVLGVMVLREPATAFLKNGVGRSDEKKLCQLPIKCLLRRRKKSKLSSDVIHFDVMNFVAVSAMAAKGVRINEERVVLDRSSEKPLKIIKVQIANVESRFTIAISESGEIVVEGRLKDRVPHLTKVGAFEVDVSLEGNIILCRQFDQPNTIGSVTSILGEENLNISSMSVGSTTQRKQAVMVIAVSLIVVGLQECTGLYVKRQIGNSASGCK
ncbi:hypothetical protein Tco_1258520 [Tanacetum coccineum]